MAPRLVLLGVAGVWLAGCTPTTPPTSGFGPMVRVCDGADCRMMPTASVAREPEVDRRGERQSDPDSYRGEAQGDLQAAAGNGDAVAAYKLGQVNEYGLGGQPRRPAEARRWYASAAEAGHPWASFRLAEMLGRGVGGPVDRGRAAQLTGRAAEGGVAQAAYNMGLLHLTGRDVGRDPVAAARWLTIAAEGGVPEAQYNLGLMYYRGDGVGRQLFQALTWMRQAAQGGYPPAQKAVGRLYMTGLDTMGQDLNEARTWLTAAAAGGDRESQEWLRQIDQIRREELAFQRQLQLQAQQTAQMWATVALAAILTPPPVVYYVRRW